MIELQELNSQKQENSSDLEQGTNAIKQIKAEKDEIEKQIQNHLNQINIHEQKLRPMVQDFEHLQSIATDTAETVAAKTKECLEYSDRVIATRSSEQIEMELRRATARVKEKEQEYGNYEHFCRLLDSRRSNLTKAKDESEAFKKELHFIKKLHLNRSNRFKKIKHVISERAKRVFASLVRRRGFRGVLTLNHEKEELELEVDVENVGVEFKVDQKVVRDKDPRALSGGEKSYATICLLLALWEIMASPFRALDEFDVFMDAVNRRLAMKLIVENARRQEDKCQYLLISPQNTSYKLLISVKDLAGPDIKVQQMPEPERGQTRLNFQRRSASQMDE